MFTGLIQFVSEISEIVETDEGKKFTIKSPFIPEIGESIAVDGVCLTVAEIVSGGFGVDVMPETLGLTTLDTLTVGDVVNLERALRVGDALGGHFVQGHVDGMGMIIKILQNSDGCRYEVVPPLSLLKYIAKKGSMAINGVSLTVSNVGSDSFEVALIPHTLKNTNLGGLTEGAKVNLEVDILARYLEKFNS